jgi:hypothetical protein
MLGCYVCGKKIHTADWDNHVGECLRRPSLCELDEVNSPKHYNSHPSGVQCIQVTEHFGFNLGNVIKYLWRAEEKGAPLKDLKKAQWYLNREIAKREKDA